MTIRIVLNVLLFVSILFFPWWLTLVFGLVLLIRYAAYEIILYGFFADTIYGIPLPEFYGIQFLCTAVFMIALFASFFIKKKIIFYQSA